MSTAHERFWSKVDRRGPDECWEWTAGKNPTGYGAFHPQKNSTIGAHRWALGEKIGRALRSDEFACHRCDNPPCVNPAHLFVGTHVQNMADMRGKGRSSRGARRPNARLDHATVRSIRELAARGVPSRDLASKHRVSESAICMIIRGQRWAHAGGPITHHYNTDRKVA